MTRLRLIHSPNFDRDLPDPGAETDDAPCRTCGGEREGRFPDCDRCHWGEGPPDDYNEPDEPDDAREPLP